MIRSMTGFASASITLSLKEHAKVSVSLSLKSLNSRFFDSNCKLPYPLNTFETEFIKLFKQHLHRGYVHFIIHVSSTEAFQGSIEPSLHIIKGYLEAAETIKKTFGVTGSLTIAEIVRLPNVFNSFQQEIDEESKKQIFAATKQLIASLITMQEAEGVALAKDLGQRLAILHSSIATIEQSFTQIMSTQKERVHAELAELKLDESKLAEAQRNALYTQLDKLDIHEEIVRFKSHLTALQKELDAPSIEKGKRLDFILQELSREINTITAKCSDSTISTHAINIKVELEKAREQAQNLV